MSLKTVSQREKDEEKMRIILKIIDKLEREEKEKENLKLSKNIRIGNLQKAESERSEKGSGILRSK